MMSKILHIASSSNLQTSVSRQIGSLVMENLKRKYPDVEIIERDLIQNPLPHLSPEFVNVMFAGQNDAPALALSELLIEELMASDLIVLEAPMYNFTIPSALKAWIDHVVRAGRTFRALKA
jgi:FMN-dependent NADH-azoreductase